LARELPITGYLDRLSARPGERLVAHVSVAAGGACRARLLRAISVDANPAGPGRRFEDLSPLFDRTFEGRRQAIAIGSHARVDPAPRRSGAARTWTALVWTGLPTADRAVLSDEGEGRRATLGIGPEGVELVLAWPGGEARLAAGRSLDPRRWYRLWASVDRDRLRVGQSPLDGGEAAAAEGEARGVLLPSGGTVLIAAENAEGPRRHFSGKIEAPAIMAQAVAAWGDPGRLPDGELVAAWDFAFGIDTDEVCDIGPQACHGRLVNTPTRAMVGALWSGRETCWRHAPADYAAIHFHADDLGDCGWQPDFEFTLPETLRSGSYALHLSCAAGEDWLPFFVRPRRGGPQARIAFLASTFTYQAYANFARSIADTDFYRGRVAAFSAYPYIPNDYPIYGRSTYNAHDDGSGIAISSRRRPIINMRPGYISANDPIGSGARHYVADHHLLAWLEDKGIEFDILTDEDLDDEGVAALAPYRALLTGSHPEYHTLRMLDALEAYKKQGGRIAYLGGNGFYWRIARDPARPHLIELRRAEGGVRMWAAEPGEYHHMLDGQLGGLWRRSRRPPQQLVGVGFTVQGGYEATYYRRTPESYDPRHGWIFAGIDEEIIGDYGLCGGGAAGFELDRVDPALGTPQSAVVIARSEKHPVSFELVPEDLLAPSRATTGEPPAHLVRADMTYFETPQGGAVFSAGSITFCGSLWRNGFEGPVSRLLYNVVTRFAAGGP
jgi:N,N-dimethylformamidase